MDASELKLLERLNRTTDTRKRISILHELAELNYRTDGNKRLAFANEACKLAQSIRDISSEVKSLYFIADAQFYLGDFEPSIQTYEHALQLSETLPETEKVALLLGMSYPLTAQGKYEQVFELLNTALDIRHRHGQRKKTIPILLRIAAAYYQLSDYKKSFDYSYQGLLLAKELEDRASEAKALDRIALIYSETGESEKALATFEEQLLICREVSDEYGEPHTLGNIGILYREKGDYEHALQYAFAALRLFESQGNMLNQIYSRCNISSVYLSMGDLDKSLATIEEGVELIKSIDFHYVAHIGVFGQYAAVLSKLGQYEKALHYLHKILPLMEGGKKQEMHTTALENIIEAYEGLGNSTKALEYHKKLLILKTEALRIQMDHDLQRMAMRHEVERKEAEKEVYRLKSLQLEEELKANVQSVIRLGKEVADRNEFLSSMKQKVQVLIPSANGSERALRSFVKEIEEKIASGDAQQQFDAALKQLHVEFLTALAEQYPELTSTEKKVCSLIKLGLNSNQIADLLFTSIRTIEGHRLKIRKKLKLQAQADIGAFLEDIVSARSGEVAHFV
jgi:tetratricopeptide (TPR) repeat protein